MTNQPINIAEWRKKFDLLWGLAPPDSLKGKKGEEIKSFISSLSLAVIEAMRFHPLDEYRSDATNRIKGYFEKV